MTTVKKLQQTPSADASAAEKPKKLLLTGGSSGEVAVLKSEVENMGLQALHVSIDRLPTLPLGTAFDAVVLNASSLELSFAPTIKLIKSRFAVPVLVLLSLPPRDRIHSLYHLDADELLFLPLRFDELETRIELLLWRSKRQREVSWPFVERRRARRVAALETDNHHHTTADRLVVDDRLKQVRIGARAIRVTPKEFQLLLLLASDPGRVFSVGEIAAHLWPRKRSCSSDVQQYVHLVRLRIEKDPGNPEWLLTEPGFGYRLRA